MHSVVKTHQRGAHIYSQLSRSCKARGTCTGLVTVGPTKEINFFDLINQIYFWIESVLSIQCGDPESPIFGRNLHTLE